MVNETRQVFYPGRLNSTLYGVQRVTPSSLKHCRQAPYNYVTTQPTLHVQKKELSNKILVKILK